MIVGWLTAAGDKSEWATFVILTLALSFLVGSALGSLSNVFIFRLPRHMPLTRPRHSICSNCKSRLTILDMFPVISYLLLKGKCRHCGQEIPARYLIVELLQGVSWTIIWSEYLLVRCAPWTTALLTVLATVALIFTFIYAERKSMARKMAAQERDCVAQTA